MTKRSTFTRLAAGLALAFAAAGSHGQPEPAAAPPAHAVPAVADFSTCAFPKFPPDSLRMHETGKVALSFLIGTDGRVLEAKVDQSSGYQRLDAAALTAIARCRFRPAYEGALAQPAWTRMQYVWEID